MQIFKGPQKNESISIELANKSIGRLLVAISWDMRELEKIKLPKPEQAHVKTALSWVEDCIHLFRTTRYLKRPVNEYDDIDERNIEFEQFDLDLHCYIFDAENNIVDDVEADFSKLHDESKTVYHSGDDFTGLGAGDDEQVYIHTTQIPDEYHHFIFVVKSDCAFSLDEIENPVIRIADSQTNENFLEIGMEAPANLNAPAFIAAVFSRHDNAWSLKTIGEYSDFDISENTFREILSKV